jgi:hypothetical protein
MAARLIDGKAVAAKVRAEVAEGVAGSDRSAGWSPGSPWSASATTRPR